MKIKNILVSTLLVLSLTIAALTATMPSVNAADIPTYAFISVTPNPVGVNQEAIVLFWLSAVTPTASGAGGDRWTGYRVTITKPDGSNETRGPFTADAVSTAYFFYTPTTLGTYRFQFSFPGQTISATGNNYQPSMSAPVELVVQQEPIPDWPASQLPTSYWERPVSAENREWAPITGNWLMPANDVYSRPFDGGSAFAPYTQAPNSAHVVWKKPLDIGGLIGGQYGSTAYYTGLSYETKFSPPIVINGILYYNAPNYPRYGFYAVDIRTGEELWFNNGSLPTPVPPPANEGGIVNPLVPLSMGQIFDYESPNQHGGIPYLWSIWGGSPNARYEMYDARTGNRILSIVNATTGTPYFGPNGEILVYVLSGAANRLTIWNSSRAIPPPFVNGSGALQWRPGLSGQVLNWSNGIQLSVTVPDVPGAQSILNVGEGVVLAQSSIAGAPTVPGSRQFPLATFVHVAYNATTGEQMWVENRTDLGDEQPIVGTVVPMREGAYALFKRETQEWFAYSLTDGRQLWKSEPYDTNAWAQYMTGVMIANGKLISAGYDGYVHALDISNGNEVWKYFSGNAGREMVYGHWPFYGGQTIADGKVFAFNGEHSPTSPMPRGEKLHVINLDNGAPVWNISGWFEGNSAVIADGYLVALNGYENELYCFGKGKTTTTLSLTSSSIGRGGWVGITGTVLDQSPAQPNTPAVSKDIMSAQMEWLHMEKPVPQHSTASGVSVLLYATNAAGEHVEIGRTTTSGSDGHFSFRWTPPAEELYSITAVFEGDDSYWSSYAVADVAVGPPQPGVTFTPTPTGSPSVTTPPSPGGEPPMVLYIVIAAVVIIAVLAAIAALLRRRH